MSIQLSFLGRYNAGSFNTSRAEIVATDGVNANRAYVVNGEQNRIDILNIANPAAPSLLSQVTLAAPAGQIYTINSVAGFNGLLVAAVGISTQAGRNAESGAVVFFTPDGTILRTVPVGAGPDMVTFSPNGRKVLTANEGEPVATGADPINPEGSVSVIDLPSFTPGNAASIAAAVAGAATTTVGFSSLTGAQISAAVAQGLKIQAGVPVAQDLEPEYIAVSPDGTQAFVTLQENNGLAVVNLATNSLQGVVGLRAINMNVSPQFQLDSSDQDGGINIKNQPVRALFQPDAIQSFQANGRTFLITANEGDSREWTGANFPTPIVEALRAGASGYTINPSATGTASGITTYGNVTATAAGADNAKAAGNLGRLNVSTFAGDTDGNAANGFEQIVIGGSRSVSIWDTAGNLVWDSGKFLETLTARVFPNNFNANHNGGSGNAADNRSDDKGPEPEGVEVGVINGVPYAFVGLEREGGIVVFELSNPSAPRFVQYLSTRDFTVQPNGAGLGGDNGPEGLKFIPSSSSPTGKPMLAVAYEVSNTTAFYAIEPPAAAQQSATTVNGSLTVTTQAGLASATSGSLGTTAAGVAPGTAYRLQILHGSDFEAGLKSIAPDGGGPMSRAANFAAIVDRIEDTFANSITLSGGDNFIPGPVYAAGGDSSLNATYNYVYNRLFDRPVGPDGRAVDINGDGVVDGYNSLAAGPGRVDITLLNIIGVQASALGNHDFDSGPRELANIARQTYAGAAGVVGDTWVGAQFPYLSANLNFSADTGGGNTAEAYTNQIREWSTYRTGPAESLAAGTANVQAKFAPSTIITENGEKIAVIGATTQLLATISSPQAVRVVDADGNVIPSADDMVGLAAVINAESARIKAADPSINKFILTSHLQQLSNEKALAPLLNDIDVILAAGSHTLAADPTDPLRPGDVATDTYPIVRTNASGNATLIVVTANEYAYVGRLVADFDTGGNIVTSNINAQTSDAFSTDWAGVKRVYGINDDAQLVSTAFNKGDTVNAPTKGYLAQAMIEGVNLATGDLANGTVSGATVGVADVVRAKDGNVFGRSDVYINGLRVDVRTQETNLGDLSADANLWYARQYDPTVQVSLKNGGGIRDSIGSASTAGGATQATLGPPAANPDAGKPAGAISQLDIENSLRFNNALTLVTVSAAELERIVEWGYAAAAPGATPGQFAQLGGLKVAYDPNLQPITFNPTTGDVTQDGQRVRYLALTDDSGAVTTTLVENGQLVVDPAMAVRMVTLNFIAGNTSAGQALFGGDSYPVPLYSTASNPNNTGPAANRVDLSVQSGFPAPPANLQQPSTNKATFATAGTEQDAFAEYTAQFFSTTPYQQADTDPTKDTRVVSLSAQPDSALAGQYVLTAPNDAAVTYVGRGGDDILTGAAGNDNLTGGSGNDRLVGNAGDDLLSGGTGNDQLLGGAGNDTMNGGAGADAFDGGTGSDTATYDGAAAAVNANLADVSQNTGEAAGDTYASIENVTGSRFDDTIVGNGEANRLVGGAGNDRLSGAGGDDILVGGSGTDHLAGGDGFDTVDNSVATSTQVTILEIGIVEANGTAGDSFAGIEAVIGGTGADFMFGDGQVNAFDGGAGDDHIAGGGGADRLTGGAGGDTFYFIQATDGRDVITDFSVGAGGDRINFAGLFLSEGMQVANVQQALSQGFITARSGDGGTIVSVDVDGAAGSRAAIDMALLQNVVTSALTIDSYQL